MRPRLAVQSAPRHSGHSARSAGQVSRPAGRPSQLRRLRRLHERGLRGGAALLCAGAPAPSLRVHPAGQPRAIVDFMAEADQRFAHARAAKTDVHLDIREESGVVHLRDPYAPMRSLFRALDDERLARAAPREVTVRLGARTWFHDTWTDYTSESGENSATRSGIGEDVDEIRAALVQRLGRFRARPAAAPRGGLGRRRLHLARVVRRHPGAIHSVGVTRCRPCRTRSRHRRNRAEPPLQSVLPHVPASGRAGAHPDRKLDYLVLDTVLDQCCGHSPQINLGGLGESLLHSGLPCLLARIKRSNRAIRTGFNTNGIGLAPAAFDWLLDGRVDYLSISLNAPDAASYQWLVGAPVYNRLASQTRIFLEAKGKGIPPLTTVHVFALPRFAATNSRVSCQWESLADFVRVRRLGNWGGFIGAN